MIFCFVFFFVQQLPLVEDIAELVVVIKLVALAIALVGKLVVAVACDLPFVARSEAGVKVAAIVVVAAAVDDDKLDEAFNFLTTITIFDRRCCIDVDDEQEVANNDDDDDVDDNGGCWGDNDVTVVADNVVVALFDVGGVNVAERFLHAKFSISLLLLLLQISRGEETLGGACKAVIVAVS